MLFREIPAENVLVFNDTNRVLAKGVGFSYLLPHPGLRSWISNYSVTFPGDCHMPDGYVVIPHGCATLVLALDGNGYFCNLFGPTTKPVCVGSDANRCQALFITEFHPAGFYAFCGIPQHELAEVVIPFEAINPTLSRMMAHSLETAADFFDFIEGIDKLFLAHLKISSYHTEFSLANQMLVDSGGGVSVARLSKNVFTSERHLNRLFREYLGVNVKSFARLIRVNRAIRLLRRRDYSLTQIFMQTGFYDISHLIHDFKSICGVTPQVFRDNLSDFYSEIAKF